MSKARQHATMTWLQYYQAVKHGDLETVKKATDKDFRITLTMDKCAVELAALYGHLDLVKYFLEKLDEKDCVLTTRVLNEALRGGHLEVVKNIVNSMDISTVDTNVVNAAINGKNLHCLEFIWQYADCKSSIPYRRHAFSSGSHEMMKFIEMNCERNDLHVSNGRHYYIEGEIPASYSMIGLNNYDIAMAFNDEVCDSSLEFFIKDKYNVKTFTLLDVAGHFGQLECLKRLIERERREHPNAIPEEWDGKFQSVLEFALRNDHINIVEYLVNEEKIDIKPLYMYDCFGTNESVRYLQKRASTDSAFTNALQKSLLTGCRILDYLDYTDYLATSMIKLEEDRSAARLTKVEAHFEYILNICAESRLLFDIGSYFMTALSEQNVDAALCCQKVMTPIHCGSPRYHEKFSIAINSTNNRFPLLPSPVIVELLLSTLKEGCTTCECSRRMDPLAEFFRIPVYTDPIGPLGECYKRRPPLAVEMYVQQADTVLELLFDHGFPKLDSYQVNQCLSDFFFARRMLSVTAGKVISMLRCHKINGFHMASHYTPIADECVEFFRVDWPKRDEILTELFITLFPNGWRKKFLLDLFLVYCVEPIDRRNHFLNCLERTGNDPEDTFLNADGPAEWMRSRDELRTSVDDIQGRVPTLQEWARYTIHNRCLQLAHDARRHVSVKTLLVRVGGSLPQALNDYLMFEDVYKTLNYEYPGQMEGGYVDKIKDWLSYGNLELEPTVHDLDSEEFRARISVSESESEGDDQDFGDEISDSESDIFPENEDASDSNESFGNENA